MRNTIYVALYSLIFLHVCKNNLYAQHDFHDFDVCNAETISGLVIIDGVVPYAVAGEFVKVKSVMKPYYTTKFRNGK